MDEITFAFKHARAHLDNVPVTNPWALRWTPVEERLPEMKPGLPSELVLVQVQEFGQSPAIAIARCWQSSLPDQPVTWYLDPEVYHLEGPWRIAEPVVAWLAIPPFTTEKP